MLHILDIASKDLLQIVRNRLTFLFLLIMPVGFTLLFGVAFGGFGGKRDPRLPIGYLNLDGGQISLQLGNLLKDSTVIRLDEKEQRGVAGPPKAGRGRKIGRGTRDPGRIQPIGPGRKLSETDLYCRSGEFLLADDSECTHFDNQPADECCQHR